MRSRQAEASRAKAVKNGLLDAHNAVRHGLSRLPVYTVDDSVALALDDEFPVKPVAGVVSRHRVRVNFVNPATLIAPRLANSAHTPSTLPSGCVRRSDAIILPPPTSRSSRVETR